MFARSVRARLLRSCFSQKHLSKARRNFGSAVVQHTQSFRQDAYVNLRSIACGVSLATIVTLAVAENKQKVSKLDERFISELKEILGDRLSVDEGELEHHGKDISYHEGHAPQAIAYPLSTDETSRIVKACAKYQVPIIPYGSGTSLEGHTTAPQGGLCVDFSQMRKLVDLHIDDMDVVVQAGLSWQELNTLLEPFKLWFPVDPGPGASIGGMIGTSCSGTNAVRYGTMKANVLNLTVVLPNGEVVKTAQRARKSSAGYDLTHLFIGAEGTLGLVTEATLKLQRIPAASSVAVCSFPTIDDASKTVIQMMQQGLSIGRVELLDIPMMRAINIHANFSYPEKPHLFFEFSGSEGAVRECIESVKSIAADHGASEFKWATDKDERTRLWLARKEAYWAAGALRPGSEVWTTDVCVPISNLAKCIHETEEDLKKTFLIAPLVGHVGDGNFHLLILLDPNNAEELLEAQRLNKRLVMRAISMEGTCTGEHGVGVGKREYLIPELGPNAVQLMRTLKAAVDPQGIMNPGKLLPD